MIRSNPAPSNKANVWFAWGIKRSTLCISDDWNSITHSSRQDLTNYNTLVNVRPAILDRVHRARWHWQQTGGSGREQHWEEHYKKWDVTRKQALKHTGQCVTLCYFCCKAASTRRLHMLLSPARTCPLPPRSLFWLCLRTSQRASMHHVEVN